MLHQVIIAAVSLVVGAGCGYGFRGWIARQKEALAKDVANVTKKL